MKITRYLINRSQALVMEAQDPNVVFSIWRRAESDGLQLVFKAIMLPFMAWRLVLSLIFFPKIIIGWIAVSLDLMPVPAPVMELAQAKNNGKIGKKVGFQPPKKAGHS